MTSDIKTSDHDMNQFRVVCCAKTCRRGLLSCFSVVSLEKGEGSTTPLSLSAAGSRV